MAQNGNIQATPEMIELMQQMLAAQDEAPAQRKAERKIEVKDKEAPATYKQKAFLGNLLLDIAFPNGLQKGDASSYIEHIKIDPANAQAIAAGIMDNTNA
jgi:hypothetical protein